MPINEDMAREADIVNDLIEEGQKRRSELRISSRWNAIQIMPIQSLEIGDVFSMPFLDGTITGKMTGGGYTPRDLTADEIQYMKDNGLDIPKNEWFPFSDNSIILFGEFHFVGTTLSGETYIQKHMYVDFHMNVAVMSTRKR